MRRLPARSQTFGSERCAELFGRERLIRCDRQGDLTPSRLSPCASYLVRGSRGWHWARRGFRRRCLPVDMSPGPRITPRGRLSPVARARARGSRSYPSCSYPRLSSAGRKPSSPPCEALRAPNADRDQLGSSAVRTFPQHLARWGVNCAPRTLRRPVTFLSALSESVALGACFRVPTLFSLQEE